jgi:hypothetical protein
MLAVLQGLPRGAGRTMINDLLRECDYVIAGVLLKFGTDGEAVVVRELTGQMPQDRRIGKVWPERVKYWLEKYNRNDYGEAAAASRSWRGVFGR